MAAEALHLELLHACPLSCLACDHRLAGPARLSAAGLRPVFASKKFSGLRLISFSGGEPLLHSELGAIIAMASSAFPSAALVLLTSLYDEARALALLHALPAAALGRLHVGASLDGPEEVHDEMRGKKGAFAALRKTHAAIKALFPALSTGFTFTATRHNSAFFYDAWLEAAGMGAPLGLQFLVPNANTAGLALGPADKKRLAAGLRAALDTAPSDNLRAALDFLEGGPRRTACGAGRTFFMLSPEGLFYLCPFHKELTAPLARLRALRSRLNPPADETCRTCFLRCAR